MGDGQVQHEYCIKAKSHCSGQHDNKVSLLLIKDKCTVRCSAEKSHDVR